MSDAKSLADLSPFFSKRDAKATVIVDCKLDDALCLWYFFLLNFSRPAGHRVQIDIFVVGIRDLAGGVALAKDVFQEAKGYAANAIASSSSVQIDVEVYATNGRCPPQSVRHEADTFAPYRNGTAGFPQADEVSLKHFQDRSDTDCGAAADFVIVTSQFLNWAVLRGDEPGFNVDVLAQIVPKAGGMLAFQMGYNTILRCGQEDQKAVWDALIEKVDSAGAKMVFISNIFSFAQGGQKPGSINPHSTPFVDALKRQSPKLWNHLFHAGELDAAIFACDQIAKWIVGLEPLNMEAPPEVKGAVDAFCAALQIEPSGSGDFQEVSVMIKAVIARGADGVAKVLAACTALFAVCSESCGETRANYLGRAESNLKKHGSSVEITDGQHLMALFQSKMPVLQPVAELSWVQAARCFSPSFGSEGGTAVMWAAKDILVERSLSWMEQGLQVPAAYDLTLRATEANGVASLTNLAEEIKAVWRRKGGDGRYVLTFDAMCRLFLRLHSGSSENLSRQELRCLFNALEASGAGVVRFDDMIDFFFSEAPLPPEQVSTAT